MLVVADVEVLGLGAIFEVAVFELEVVLLHVRIDFAGIDLLLHQGLAVEDVHNEVHSNADESRLARGDVDAKIELLRLPRGEAKREGASLVVTANLLAIDEDLVDAEFELQGGVGEDDGELPDL